jgi:hypothetical protein
MVALQGDTVTSVCLADVAGCTRAVPADHELLAVARTTGVMLGGTSAPSGSATVRRPEAAA